MVSRDFSRVRAAIGADARVSGPARAALRASPCHTGHSPRVL